MENTPPPQPSPPHFLVVTYPAQGHINPTLRLAKRLAATAAGTRVTFSTAVSAHRRMFTSSSSSFPGQHNNTPLFSYIPYSNGFDDGYDPDKHDASHYLSHITIVGANSLAAIIDDLAASGRPVTCIIYSFFMSWAAKVARDRRIPCFLFWIQPATAFAIYWHYFHDYAGIIAASAVDTSGLVTLPGLPSMRIRDLPSFIRSTGSDDNDPYSILLPQIKDMFDTLEAEIDKQPPRVLANTAAELEAAAVASVADRVEIIGVGPVLDDAAEGSLFKADDAYLEWLDSQEERSVVYVSFGSISVLKKEQVEEIMNGLKETQRPYLWVLRKDSRWKGANLEDGRKQGMVVEWCEQRRVLEHRAVGCFVTHCGWNSTVEALMCGVPTVAVPQWTDQGTNAWLMESVWGTTARVEVEEGEVVAAEELRRCVEIVMGEGKEGEEIKRKATLWMKKGREAAGEGGSSDRNLKTFVEEIAGSNFVY
ncbi:UDP-glycosyltransferase 75D1 [Platanthera zijinensis]|uniref:Glycosyltransferase n=1 Tax=Platanthera zijinensis TaxID=2320716 RepID=A0AAP0BFT1_9ASPA